MTGKADEFLTDMVESLDDYYPGSRQKRTTKTTQPGPADDEPVWADPQYRREYAIEEGGDPVEFWTVGALALALNRKPVTIRLWERKGIIPRPNFRTPADGAIAGKRLYTREQVEGLARIAEEEGLLYAQVSPSKTKFTERAVELFRTLEDR